MPESIRLPLSGDFPLVAPLLEEIVCPRGADRASGFAFALSRLIEDKRPAIAILPQRWTRENGRPCIAGAAAFAAQLILIEPANDQDALWAMEQALRSGAFSGVIGAVEQSSLTQTRRLDFAAREGEATAVLLRTTGQGLSAARRRWEIRAEASTRPRWDEAAPGRACVQVELVRHRGGSPGAWLLEQDDATNRFRLADRLAGDGLVADRRTFAAA